MNNHIYVSLSTFAEQDGSPLELLKNSGIAFSVNKTGKRIEGAELIAAAGKATGIVAGVEKYDADVLSRLPNLRCISRCGVGLDSIDLSEARNRGISICNTPEVVINPVRDLTLAMILDGLRKVTFHTALMKDGQWKRLTGRDIAAQTVGIVGIGRIGKAVAEALIALGARVVATDKAADTGWLARKKIELLPLDDLLKASDVVSIHTSGSGDCILGIREFALLKRHTLIVNTSRGSYIDETALHAFLKDNPEASAAIDVYSNEPYSGELLQLPNIILTPHIATLTDESRTRMEYEAVENAIRNLTVAEMRQNSNRA